MTFNSSPATSGTPPSPPVSTSEVEQQDVEMPDAIMDEKQLDTQVPDDMGKEKNGASKTLVDAQPPLQDDDHDGYRGSRVTRSQRREDKGKTYHEGQDQIKGLQRDVDEYRKRLKDRQEERDVAQGMIQDQNLVISWLQGVVKEQKQKIAELSQVTNHLKHHNNELQDAISQHRHNITELTAKIAQSAHSGATTARDDDYYETKFASLAGAIYQWVFRNFRGMPEAKHDILPPRVQESLKLTVFGYDESQDSLVDHQEIQAVVAERLCHHVFTSIFVLDIQKPGFHSLFNDLGGTDFEKRKWHSQTVGMVYEKSGFSDQFKKNIGSVADDIEACIGVLAPEGKQEQRRKSLFTIVEQAAKLQLECFRQVSEFQLNWIKPGDPYNPDIMEDRSGLVGGDDSVKKATPQFLVKMVLFPPVVRFGFDETGSFSKTPVTVRKGTVMAMRAGAE